MQGDTAFVFAKSWDCFGNNLRQNSKPAGVGSAEAVDEDGIPSENGGRV